MQLELFYTPSEPPKKPQIWESLSQERRETVVVVLARLMKKTIQGEPRRNKNER